MVQEYDGLHNLWLYPFPEPLSQYNFSLYLDFYITIMRFFVRFRQGITKAPEGKRPRELFNRLDFIESPAAQIQRVSVIFGSNTMTDLSISTAFCRPSFWLMRLSSCSMLIA